MNPDPHAAESAASKGPGNDAGASPSQRKPDKADRPKEFGGRRQGLEPTRYGDWEKDGRCIDF